MHIHAQCNVEQSAVSTSSGTAEHRFFTQHSRTPSRAPKDPGGSSRTPCSTEQGLEMPLCAHRGHRAGLSSPFERTCVRGPPAPTFVGPLDMATCIFVYFETTFLRAFLLIAPILARLAKTQAFGKADLDSSAFIVDSLSAFGHPEWHTGVSVDLLVWVI